MQHKRQNNGTFTGILSMQALERMLYVLLNTNYQILALQRSLLKYSLSTKFFHRATISHLNFSNITGEMKMQLDVVWATKE
jgi:hypothetical protein